jgi:MFS family permease
MITGAALPLTALLVLSASPVEMGLLGAVGMAPVLLVGLPAGVWVDRLRRRPLMIWADVCRAVLLFSVPAAFLLGTLSMAQLYVVAALTGALNVLFDVSYRSYLPSLVRREQLVEGNSKLSMSNSVAEVAGPATGGILVQIATAPIAILVDAFSFLASALSLWGIRAPEPEAARRVEGANVWRDVAEGLRAIAHQPLLRALALTALIANFFGGFFHALYSLYVIRELGMGPALLGVLVSAGGVGALAGAFLAQPAARRIGPGPTLIWAVVLAGGMQLLVPLAGGPVALAFAMLFMTQVIGDIGWAVYAISEMSLRQGVTPDRLLGRVNASMEFVAGGIGTVGLLVGGMLGEQLGLRPTIAVAAVGIATTFLVVLRSPARTLREQPTVAA